MAPEAETGVGGTPQSRWLSEHRARTAATRDGVSAVEARWSWGRLLTFLAAALVWYPLLAWPWLSAAAFLGGIVLFVYTVRRHLRVRAERDLLDRVLLMIDESAQRLGGNVVLVRSHARPHDAVADDARLESVIERGPTWPLTNQERDDLDLYNPPVGLFGLLNRTSTLHGARRLRDWFENPCLSAGRIREIQDAVGWLGTHPAERLRLLAAAAVLRKEDEYVDRFLRAVRGAHLPASLASVRLLRWWSVLSGLFAVVAVTQAALGQLTWALGLFALLFVNGAIFQRLRKTLAQALAPWQDVSRATDGYRLLAAQAVTDLPGEGILGVLRQRFAAVQDPAVLPTICRRVGWAESGGAFHLLLNMLIFYDLHVAGTILRHVLPHQDPLVAGVAAMADLEVLLSLACFAWEQPATAFPTASETPVLRISAGRHVLIAPQRVVANDVVLEAETRVGIITGSNMAGKSTYLRMIGTNMLLAQIGSAVAADEMIWSPLCLLTDLRAADSLAQNESYFLAEVRHIRRMVLPPDHGAPLLGLIDEPFRGTNSYEQVAASVGVVRHLIQADGFFLVATHERRLTELADGRVARNFHFRENLGQSGLVFDYLLRTGPAQTRNALRVLEQEGYPRRIVDWAHEVIEEVHAERPLPEAR